MIASIEVALLVFIVVSALLTALLRDALAAIIMFGAYSLGMAVLWIVFRAPDVGLTEAAVGAGIMTILLLVSIARTTRLTGIDLSPVSINWTAVAACAAFTVLILATVPALPEIGDPTAPAFDGVYEHYVTEAYDQTHVENVVTAILVAYRGFDTLGEATVVFTAGVAVLTVLKQEVDE
ncbi:DUF4040 domain-containing protein [Halovivax limisalsi]|uniref:DUF4040 domain-containing protein n=1 Tax=Halovivax limisalsi TaxID=1453760 RepID=UPI001FFD304A|nr:DUF4040 domain-containing protein [Halovivax limisalsi]